MFSLAKKVSIVAPVISPDSPIEELNRSLANGTVSSVELVSMYLNRIAAHDRTNARLNAVPVLNPDVYAEAQAADRARATREAGRPLLGIPFTVKDSFKAAGLTVSGGSPVFKDLHAQEDSAAVELLREAGAVLLG